MQPEYKKPKTESDDFCSSLLERAPPVDYVQEWTDVLMKQTVAEKTGESLSVVVFRLAQDWLALATNYFKQITYTRPIHSIPHNSRKILLGTVNLDGVLQLCVSLNQLLEIEAIATTRLTRSYQQDRMIAIVKEGDLWVFPVDEIDGIHVWNLAAIENVPVNVSKSSVNYLKGIMNNQSRSVGLLDEELLFYSLKRSIQ